MIEPRHLPSPLGALALLLVVAGCTFPTGVRSPVAPRPVSTWASPNGGWAGSYSPDGSKIAFLSSTLHTPANLWVMNADGGAARPLTRRGADSFRWLADGQALHFSTRRRGFSEVMRAELEAGAPQRVPGLPPNASVPVYSPDGRLFALTVVGTGKIRDLWIGTADGSRLEAVTEKLGVRSVFWGPDSRTIYYEVGKTYGVGIWRMDLATIESSVLLNKYIGTPTYSPVNGLIAYAFPDNPGEFSVHTMTVDGDEVQVAKAPRLTGRWLVWGGKGEGVYYVGQDIAVATDEDTSQADEASAVHPQAAKREFARVGVSSLWYLDLASGEETRVTSSDLHLTGFAVGPDAKSVLLSGVLPDSFAGELFRLNLENEQVTRLTRTRPSAWMPVATRDSAKIAFFTNESKVDSLEVVTAAGERLESHPGIAQEGGVRLFWLPESEGLLIFSPRGLGAFTSEGPISFANRGDHRAYLYADVSIQSDSVLISSIPRYGELPGLYMLDVVDAVFRQSDLRYPAAPERAAELYLQPKWSFDGNLISFSDKIDIWVMNADGSGRRRITHFYEANIEGKARPALATHPVWSSSGTMLCFTKTVYEEQEILRQLWTVQRDGAKPQLIHSEPVASAFQWRQEESTNLPFFDLTDERLIFTRLDDGLPNLYAAETKSGKIRRLTETGAIYPVLLPEEDLIVYISLEGNNERLRVMNGNGSEKRPFPLARNEVAGEHRDE